MQKCCDKEYPRLAQTLPIDFVNILQSQTQPFHNSEVEQRNKDVALRAKIAMINAKYNSQRLG